MATVTGYTAARMKQIEDAAIIDGEVVGNNLILEPKGFATAPGTYPKIDAGNVRGPIGPQGVPGEVTTAALNAALLAAVPPGSIMMWGGAAAPATWALCDGGTSSRTTEAALFAAIGTTYGIGNGTTTFNRPNFQSKFPAGKGAAAWSDALNDQGGNKDAILVSHAHTAPGHQHSTPGHQHTIGAHAHDMTHGHGNTGGQSADHVHGVNIVEAGAHQHNASEAGYSFILSLVHAGGGLDFAAPGPPNKATFLQGGTAVAGAHQHAANVGGYSADHVHGIPNFNGNTGTQGAYWTGGEGASTTGTAGGTATTTEGITGTDANLPPFITVNFIIKL